MKIGTIIIQFVWTFYLAYNVAMG